MSATTCDRDDRRYLKPTLTFAFYPHSTICPVHSSPAATPFPFCAGLTPTPPARKRLITQSLHPDGPARFVPVVSPKGGNLLCDFERFTQNHVTTCLAASSNSRESNAAPVPPEVWIPIQTPKRREAEQDCRFYHQQYEPLPLPNTKPVFTLPPCSTI
ncbi:uncharacterized protein LY79DRAFT_69607 [Colletotrichum navitas]|uniref:Uncharacterized protein n=1 Tax=Colletotrichum navitas TaxID=681940 RepID=A0AAD8UWS5_9PEZI|nr:uncharacterized protein LY79DRAFT_69607 [Colletotrichum navitas]KAK1569745.1 hypothetical protein LY79DRAFT_69607 [Colletotrichum navitas]